MCVRGEGRGESPLLRLSTNVSGFGCTRGRRRHSLNAATTINLFEAFCHPLSASYSPLSLHTVHANSAVSAQVVRTLQVVGAPNIFAGGDVCMRYAFEEKCVRTALRHAAVIAGNILRMMLGKATAGPWPVWRLPVCD